MFVETGHVVDENVSQEKKRLKKASFILGVLKADFRAAQGLVVVSVILTLFVSMIYSIMAR